MKYRSRTEIVSMILEAANGGATKTKIMYKITITLILGYSAPSMYCDATNENDAIKIARKQSGLGRFPEWKFTANKIK